MNARFVFSVSEPVEKHFSSSNFVYLLYTLISNRRNLSPKFGAIPRFVMLVSLLHKLNFFCEYDNEVRFTIWSQLIPRFVYTCHKIFIPIIMPKKRCWNLAEKDLVKVVNMFFGGFDFSATSRLSAASKMQLFLSNFIITSSSSEKKRTRAIVNFLYMNLACKFSEVLRMKNFYP